VDYSLLTDEWDQNEYWNLIKEKELHFQLYEIASIRKFVSARQFSEQQQETFDAVLATANQIATGKNFSSITQNLMLTNRPFDGEKSAWCSEVKVRALMALCRNLALMAAV